MVDLGLPGMVELLPYVGPSPGLEYLDCSEDREGGQGEEGEHPAQGVAPVRVLVLAVVVGGGPVVQDREHPDDQDEARGGELPREHEECRGLAASHVGNILCQS